MTIHNYWWSCLTPDWKKAFGETVFRHANEPSEEELMMLCSSTVLRLAAPEAPYPNMSFELTDLSGIAGLVNLEILVVTHQHIERMPELLNLPKLRALFINNNRLNNLDDLVNLTNLEQLYAQFNNIQSIGGIRKLVRLREFYINYNNVSSLEGISEEHADQLEKFYCKPNERLKQCEMLRVEKEYGVRCLTV